MASFKELGGKIRDAGQSVARSTRDLTRVGRLNGVIADREKELEKRYAALGRRYYESGGALAPEEADELTGAVRALAEEIEGCREEIRRLRERGKCPACGVELPQGAAFCPACGAPVPAPQPEEPQQVCPACGKAVGEENRFCNYCGAKLD